jgi:SAM-dependent methyltransferase
MDWKLGGYRKMIKYYRLIGVPKFVFLNKFIKENKNPSIRVLDVGCGNKSPSITKELFPAIEYYGIDKEEYNLGEQDKRILIKDKNFFLIDLDSEIEKLDYSLPNEYFDFCIMNHVIEHLKNGMDVLRIISKKVKVGGAIYIEFPGVRSLGLPSMKGTLNFCDDPTHVRVYTIQEIANILLDNGFRIKKAGVRRKWFNIILLPLKLSIKAMVGREGAGDFWDLFGFAEFVYAEKIKEV